MNWSERRRERRARRAAERARERWEAPRVAFALSGGGVLGAVQVGQLRALIEAGITPDVVVGTSVGSLNAAKIASSPSLESIAELDAIWTSLKTDDIFPGSRVARVWSIVARGDHMHPNDGIRRLVERLGPRTFEELAVPLHVSATNLTTGAETWFESGPIMRAILASTALPGVFPPVSIDGELYVDGGVVNNVPISRAAELGARRIYVLTCGAPSSRPRPIRRPIDVLIQSFAHARAVRIPFDLEKHGGECEIVMMPTFDVGFIRYNDTGHARSLIDRAYEQSAEFLASAETAQA